MMIISFIFRILKHSSGDSGVAQEPEPEKGTEYLERFLDIQDSPLYTLHEWAYEMFKYKSINQLRKA